MKDSIFSPEAAHDLIKELRDCVERYWQLHLSPPWSSRLVFNLNTKYNIYIYIYLRRKIQRVMGV